MPISQVLSVFRKTCIKSIQTNFCRPQSNRAMKISMEVGVKTPQGPNSFKRISKLLIFLEDPGFSESKIFFGQGAESAESAESG